MSAERLRQAAAKVRETAEGATGGGPRWETAPDEMSPSRAIVYPADSDSAVAFAGADDARHIAMWHPRVALAVADLLELQAMSWAMPRVEWLALADLILGAES